MAVLLVMAGLSAMAVAHAADQVPAPWDGMDIGAPNPAGGSQTDNVTFMLTAGGGDLSGTSDQFHFVYQSVTGDFSLVARVTSQTGPSDLAKAGLMVRDALATTSNFVALVRTPGHGVRFQYRTPCVPLVGTDSVNASGTVWIRLVKRGATVGAYFSADTGDAPPLWKKVGGDQPIASGMVYVGLCLTGHTPGSPSTAAFDHVSLSTGPQPALDNGTYTVTPSGAQALVLNAIALGVGLAAPTGLSGQKWVFTAMGGSRYDIQPDSDRSSALTVAGGGSVVGAKAVLAPDQGLPGQRWSVVVNGNGTYGLVPQCAPDGGLDDFGGNATPTAVIDIWQRWTDDPHTQWIITRTP